MRKILIIMCCIMMATTMAAQERKVYCEIRGDLDKALSGKQKVSIDLGNRNLYEPQEKLYDEKGKRLMLNSVIEALNYMSKRGWSLVTAAYSNAGCRCIMEKQITSDDQITEGLILKKEAQEISKEEEEKKRENADGFY